MKLENLRLSLEHKCSYTYSRTRPLRHRITKNKEGFWGCQWCHRIIDGLIVAKSGNRYWLNAVSDRKPTQIVYHAQCNLEVTASLARKFVSWIGRGRDVDLPQASVTADSMFKRRS